MDSALKSKLKLKISMMWTMKKSIDQILQEIQKLGDTGIDAQKAAQIIIDNKDGSESVIARSDKAISLIEENAYTKPPPKETPKIQQNIF